ncbi:MAG TPA: response regulator [Candidatus Acidoferrales bacterium]
MGTRVLIIDDEPAMCDLVATILKTANMEAYAVYDPQQGLKRLRSEKFDILFVDMHMPGLDGIELTEQVRASGLNQKMQIVMMTGDTSPKILGRGYAAGVNFFLFKPMTKERMMRLVRASEDAVQRERRRFQRVPLRCRVEFQHGHRQLSATTVDMSLGGLSALGDTPFEKGAVVQMSLSICDGAPLRAAGRVVRVSEDGTVGVEFQGLTTEARERLQGALLPLILDVASR